MVTNLELQCQGNVSSELRTRTWGSSPVPRAIPYYSSAANSVFHVSVTLGVLNFSAPELHKLVLQGKKCIKWHKYLLIVYSALVPVQGREVGSVARQVPLISAVLCVCNTLLGELTNELLNSINSMPQNNFCLKVITDN